MSLLRLAQINLAIVAVLGTMLLGSAQGSFLLPVLAVVSASAAYYFTDIKGQVRLSGGVANLVALLAVAVSVSQVVNTQPTEQLVAIANLLIYLQTILLFQDKTVRVGWQLLSLSLLQVVVAAAIGDSIVFGVLVFFYLVFGLSGVALLCCYGESLAHEAAFVSVDTSLKFYQRRTGEKPARRSLEAAPAQGVVPPPLFYRGLVRCLGWLSVASVFIAAMLFVLIPRYGQARIQPTPHNAGVTGFKDNVELKSSGRRIFENDSIVMRLQLLDDETGEEFPYGRELFLRGAISYNYQSGNWERESSENDDPSAKPAIRPPNVPANVVRQAIEIEPMPHDRLFSVYPIATIYGDPRIDITPLERRRHESRMTLEIGTSGFHQGQQCLITPVSTSITPRTRWTSLSWVGRTEPPGIRTQFSGLIAWAEAALEEAEITADERLTAARFLEERLRSSGEFRYSLAMPERNPAKDPIEDFVTEHPQGNCEFFASALVLMLRSQGIPARMVMGYRSADWNPVGGYLQVRQLHAHTWAEVYLEPSQIPDSLKSPQHVYTGGGWLRLDPTPAEDGFAAATNNHGMWARMKNVFDHVDLLWRNYIVGFDRDRQDQFVYSPLEGMVDAARFALVDIGGLISTIIRAVVGAIGWVGLFVLGVVCWIALRAIKRKLPAMPKLKRLGQWMSWFTWPRWRRRATRPKTPRVAFYERFEQLVAAAGYQRLPQQTPLEFAQAIGGQLFDMPSRRIAARAPRQVVEAFYRVRYGGQILADDEYAAVERALDDLQRVLNPATT
jgi:transglutaminase-like putative cysteine protease